MTNNIFPKDINNAPLCTICFHKVVDDAKRAITKLICGHFFHTDCIVIEFNVMGIMICPNCHVIEEDGSWRRFANSENEAENEESGDMDEDEESSDEESSDEDEYNEEHPEDDVMNLLPATNDAYNGDASHMSTRHEMDIDNVPWNDAPPHIRHVTYQTNNGRNIFSRTFVDESYILQQNEWRQQLQVSPPPIAPEMVDQRISFFGPNFDLGPVRHEASTSYEQARNNVLPCLELTLATTSTSLCDERLLSPCQCINCRASSSKTHY